MFILPWDIISLGRFVMRGRERDASILHVLPHKHAGTATPIKNEKDSMGENSSCEVKPVEPTEDINSASLTEAADTVLQTNREKTLKDAVKPKHKRKNKASFASES